MEQCRGDTKVAPTRELGQHSECLGMAASTGSREGPQQESTDWFVWVPSHLQTRYWQNIVMALARGITAWLWWERNMLQLV